MRRDSTALVWGLIFAAVAALGLWSASGHAIDRAQLSVAAPLVLIAIGVLGLLMSRSRPGRGRPSSSRHHRKEPR